MRMKCKCVICYLLQSVLLVPTTGTRLVLFCYTRLTLTVTTYKAVERGNQTLHGFLLLYDILTSTGRYKVLKS